MLLINQKLTFNVNFQALGLVWLELVGMAGAGLRRKQLSYFDRFLVITLWYCILTQFDHGYVKGFWTFCV